MAQLRNKELKASYPNVKNELPQYFETPAPLLENRLGLNISLSISLKNLTQVGIEPETSRMLGERPNTDTTELRGILLEALVICDCQGALESPIFSKSSYLSNSIIIDLTPL